MARSPELIVAEASPENALQVDLPRRDGELRRGGPRGGPHLGGRARAEEAAEAKEEEEESRSNVQILSSIRPLPSSPALLEDVVMTT